MFVLKWLAGFTLREYAEAAGVALVVAFILFWDHTEIQKGRDECEARYVAAEAAATVAQNKLQAKIDHDAAAHDAAIQAVIGSPIAKPSGCVLTKDQLNALRGAK